MYLVHLFFVIPIIAVLTGFEWYVGAPGVVRVAVTLAATVAVVYPLAWVLHVAIEKPGIVLGRRVARMDGKSGSAAMPSPPRS